jgi:AcrR family transcriptional regulator
MTEAELKSASELTRERLIAAAREIFSQQGFHGATVREICRRAEANVAAVNYHFGGKDGLLAEVLNFASLKALQTANATAADCPKVRLQLFIHDFIHMLLDEHHASLQCQIMARELADPTPALDQIVRDAVAPLHQFLGELLREIGGKSLSEAQLRRSVYSILGQCMFYRNSHPVLLRLNPKLRYDHKEINAIAAHIAAFSLAGIERLATGE